MKKRFVFLCFLFMFPALSDVRLHARAPLDETRLSRDLGRYIRTVLQEPLFRNVRVAICISRVDQYHPLYEQNAYEPLPTASALKIIPAAAALAKWGPDYVFSTPVLAEGLVRDRVLYGDLYLWGKGDPSLGQGDLQKAANLIKDQGIDRVQGDLVYDISYFDEEKNRFAPNARHLYAPPCALSVNYNSIDVEILAQGADLRLQLTPRTAYAALQYHARLKHTEEPGRPDMTYEEKSWGDQFRINGVITDWDRKYHYVCLGVSRPGLYAATLFKEALAGSGVAVSGRVRQGKVAIGARSIVQISSGPVREAVRVMNQESNNLIAEMINKNLGAQFVSVPGTRAKGLEVLKAFCTGQIGIPEKALQLEDACGLSLNNRLSAAYFIRALNYFYTTPVIREHFPASLKYQALPLGTSGARLGVLSKSGTLSASGVNTEVGYLIDERTGETFSFAILAQRLRPGPMTYSGTLTNPILAAIKTAFEKQ